MADLAAEFGLPVIVVAANRLGAINHTLLTVRAVRAAGLVCAGVILNGIAEVGSDAAAMTNAAVIADLLQSDGVSLCEVEHGAERLPDDVTFRWAGNCDSKNVSPCSQHAGGASKAP
jgi:dethiobiotin synthetase